MEGDVTHRVVAQDPVTSSPQRAQKVSVSQRRIRRWQTDPEERGLDVGLASR